MIDIRCRHIDPRRATAAGRCQLAVGHEGPHAVLFLRGGERTVRTWLARGPAVDQAAVQENRPWARGFPVVAWTEAVTPAPAPAPTPPTPAPTTPADVALAR